MRNKAVQPGPRSEVEDASDVAPTAYLTFELGGEELAIPVARVREISEPIRVTRVPATPPFIRGILNLRGNVVVLLDLRVKLGQSATPITRRSCILFVEDGDGLVGLLVEAVDRVIELRPGEIAAAPAFGGRIRSEFLSGIGTVAESLVLLLALDAVLADSEGTGAADVARV